ncbi:MAG: hypothetical protein P9M03_12880 [Candidatus Theseobacter exili]|nr:hypothetical protein [Candidatus Theseobacter exili]
MRNDIERNNGHEHFKKLFLNIFKIPIMAKVYRAIANISGIPWRDAQIDTGRNQTHKEAKKPLIGFFLEIAIYKPKKRPRLNPVNAEMKRILNSVKPNKKINGRDSIEKIISGRTSELIIV